MFERFTQRSRAAVRLAKETTDDLGVGPVGTDHLVVALIHDPESVAGRALLAAGLDEKALRTALVAGRRTRLDEDDAVALRAVGIDLEAVRAQIEETFGTGALDDAAAPASEDRAHFSREAKEALRDALQAAVRLRHDYIGTEHLLLGVLTRGGRGRALLAHAGVDLDALAAEMTKGHAA